MGVKFYTIATLLLVLIVSCQKYPNPLDGEQFEKSLYIIGSDQASNQGLRIINLPYKQSNDDTASTFITVATGGSKSIDRDLIVTIDQAGENPLRQYNRLYLYKPTDIKYRYLSSDFYIAPSYDVSLKAGDVYGRMPVHFKTANLHCDSLYALSFRIAAVSDPSYAGIRQADSSLILTLRLNNAYSGLYQEVGRYKRYNSTDTTSTSLSLSRTLKAVKYNQLRLFHLTTTESVDSAANKGVLLTVNADNSVSVSSWKDLIITEGGGTYNPNGKIFDIWYNYNQAGVIYRFEGTFIKN